MAHVFQVGAGSGGIVVLDLLIREPRITAVTLVEPDVYQAHNVHRHLFPAKAVGRMKAELAAEWVRERRPDIAFETFHADITDPAHESRLETASAECDVGVCAVDNEAAKYQFDAMMRKAGKSWTLGEVLSGGIAGWAHRFSPGGSCYGCVASHLQRSVAEAEVKSPPDYSNPGGPVAETTIPASKASIEVIAGLHALLALQILQESEAGVVQSEEGGASRFTSLLFTLQRVPGLFEEAFRSYRLQIPKSPDCLICSSVPASAAGEDLDVALDQALARLGNV